MSVEPEPAPQTVHRGRVLVGLMLTTGLSAMDTTIVATAVPSIVHDLGGFSLFTWVFAVYLLAQTVTIPVYGKLADLYGRKPVLQVGTLIFLLGSVLSGLSWGMGALIAFRGLQGLGAGAIQATTLTLAGDLYSVEERGRIDGWLSSVWGISAVVGPTIGGALVEYASWRWIFYLNVPIGVAALAMIGRHLHERVAKKRHRIDVLGALLLVAAAGSLCLGLIEGGVRWEWRSWQTLAAFGGSALAFVAFAWQESRAKEPMLPLWVFRRRLLAGANLASAVVGLVTIGLSTFLPTYAQGVMGAGPIVAGFVLAAMSVSWPFASAFSNRLYLRIGFRDTALIGTAFAIAAGVLLTSLRPSAPVWTAAMGSLLAGAGLGLLSTPIIVGIQSVVGWNRRGVVTGANMFTRYLGQAVGAAAYGGIANVALEGWLRKAPPTLGAKLPRTIDAAGKVLGQGHAVSGPIAEYVRQGLFLATRHVFFALVAVAAFGTLVLLLTPRVFRTLEFPGEPPARP